MNNTYKVLEVKIKKNGFLLSEIKRQGNVALYKKTGLINLARKTKVDSGYEVVFISHHDGYEMGGVKIEASEIYPSSEKWGVHGFTYIGHNAMELAEKRFQTMLVEHGQTNSELFQGRAINIESEDASEEVVPAENTEAIAPKPAAAKSGRKAGLRPTVFIPVAEFTIKTLVSSNPDYTQPIIYMEVKRMIAEGKVKVIGSRKSEGARGKPSVVYGLV